MSGEKSNSARSISTQGGSGSSHRTGDNASRPSLEEGCLLKTLAVLFFIGFVFYLLLPDPLGHHEAPIRGHCSNNMRNIGLALQSYHAALGSFPPAYTVDADGRRMHSWRALILPYMEDQALAKQYDFNQPWDSPHNLALRDKMPEAFRCPAAPKDQRPGQTNYLVVVGPHTLFPGIEPRREKDVIDGLSNTIAVIELISPGVNWLEPVDTTPDEFHAAVQTDKDLLHDNVINALFVDASVHALRTEQLKAPKFDALISIDGREPLDNVL